MILDHNIIFLFIDEHFCIRRITDLKGPTMDFPNLEELKNLERL